MKKPKVPNPTWTTIYFFEGEEVKWQAVLTEDLARLAGAKTFWRESMPEPEIKEKIRGKVAAVLGYPPGQNAYRRIS